MDSLAVVTQLDVIEGEWAEEKRLQAPSLSVSELIGRFLASHDVRASSIATYRRQLKEFESWLKRTGRVIQEMRREDILAYRKHLQETAGDAGQGLSSYSVSGYLTAVRRLFTWLEAERIYPNVARDIKGSKRPRGHKKDTLSPEQLRDCLEAIKTAQGLSEIDRLRNYAIFNLMARTGLRDIEVARARLGDIRRVDGEPVLYVQGKGRDTADEFVLLTEAALSPIQAYLKARGHLLDEAPLFVSSSRRNYGQGLTSRSVSRIVKEALKAAGLEDRKLTAHSLRHTAITLAIQGGATLPQAQAMARHASPATTMVYFHNLDRVANGAEKYISF